jgi:hypothetical protein
MYDEHSDETKDDNNSFSHAFTRPFKIRIAEAFARTPQE